MRVHTAYKHLPNNEKKKKEKKTTLFLNILDYIRKGLPLFLKTRTLYIELLK